MAFGAGQGHWAKSFLCAETSREPINRVVIAPQVAEEELTFSVPD